MDDREYKSNLRKVVLSLAQEEIKQYASQKGMSKYLESNIDKIIDNNIKSYNQEDIRNSKYLKIVKKSSQESSIINIAKNIRSEGEFKTKSELLQLSQYLGLNINRKSPYNQILKKIASYIYMNKNQYNNDYVLYRKENVDYYLDPQKIKSELLESYKSKTRKDMKSIAKLLDIDIEDDTNAEDIRKKVINYIIREKIGKK